MTLSPRRLLAVLSLSGLFLASGCGKFFVDPNGVGGTSTCATNCVYVANNGTDDIAAFAATNPLSVVSNVNVGFDEIPTSLAVSPNNAYLYAASSSGNVISLFNIQDGGSLGAAASEVTGTMPYALAVDTTSSYLFAAGLVANSNCPGEFQIALYVYTIGADGAITNASATPASGPCGSTTSGFPTGIAVAPNDQYVFVASGTSGISGYIFSGGVATPENYLSTAVTGASSVNGVAVDPSSAYVFAAASGTPDGGVAQFLITAANVTPKPKQLPLVGTIQEADSAFAAITNSGTFLYATSTNTGQVYGFTYTSSGLAAITGSPYSPSSASSGTVAIVANTAAGVVLTINDVQGPNLQEFTIGTSGGLTAVSTGSTSTGTYAPVALAITQ